MKSVKLGLIAAIATLPLSASIADAAPHKKKRRNPGLHLAIGQNEARLAETKCGNMGAGNGGEFVFKGDCIKGVKSEGRDADPGKHSRNRAKPGPRPLTK